MKKNDKGSCHDRVPIGHVARKAFLRILLKDRLRGVIGPCELTKVKPRSVTRHVVRHRVGKMKWRALDTRNWWLPLRSVGAGRRGCKIDIVTSRGTSDQ
jgi:hypothetical protein